MSKYMKTMMPFVLAVVLILHSLSATAEAAHFLLNKTSSRTSTSSSSSQQALKGLHEMQQNPFKKVADSSLRHVPPSRSNPTQNKYKPPSRDREKNPLPSRKLRMEPTTKKKKEMNNPDCRIGSVMTSFF